MSRRRAFVAIGSNVPSAQDQVEAALQGLVAGGDAIAAASTPALSPYELLDGRVSETHPPVLDQVVELRTARDPEALLARLQELEVLAHRTRDDTGSRTLDLDLLAYEDRVRDAPPLLPHPRALQRAFVLAPWQEVAPTFPVPGEGAPVFEHADRLRAASPERFARLEIQAPLPLPAGTLRPLLLEDREALDAWRKPQGERTEGADGGVVGVVPTMGALHAGHAALLRRARAECDHVLATIFVNPLQFGPGEDLTRYPRTLDADLDLLAREGVDAVYLPRSGDLYPEDFSTQVVPEGPALDLEGRGRPGHFTGVLTVVLKLWLATRPDRAYFGQKDAQQLAVVRRMVRDLDLTGEVVACPIVRDGRGLALSSRNRYLDADAYERALALPRALETLAVEAARSAEAMIDRTAADLCEAARRSMEDAGLDVIYVAIVDPVRMVPTERSDAVSLAVAAVNVDATRLLDNRWVHPARCGRQAS